MSGIAQLLKPPLITVPEGRRVIAAEPPRRGGPRVGTALDEEIVKHLQDHAGQKFNLDGVAQAVRAGSLTWLRLVLRRLVDAGRIRAERKEGSQAWLYFIEEEA